ncbi:DUF998 domain-containing protein [Streptococcus dentiloxodontae]
MISKGFSLVAILGIIAYGYLMIVLHLKNKGTYNPIKHAVSDYGVGPYQKYFQLAGLVSTVRTIALMLALAGWSYSFSFKGTGIALLALTLVGFVGVAVFPTDLEGKERTLIGALHLLFAVLQFTALAIFIFNVTKSIGPINPTLYSVCHLLEQLVKVGLYGLVAAMILPPLKPYFGLLERLFLYSSNLYILCLCFMIFLA